MERIDLSVELVGVQFKNPVIAAPSDLTYDVRAITKCIEAGAGGIIMKGLSVQPYSRRKPIPFYFSLEHFGRGYQTGAWCSPEGYAREEPEVWLKKYGTEAVKVCHDAGVPFIAQFAIQVEDDRQALQDLAKRFEELGSDMLQVVPYSCPNDTNLPKSLPEARADHIRAIKEVVRIPIMDKINASWQTIFRDLIISSERGGASVLTISTDSTGIFVDVEREEFFGLPAVHGYMHGRAWVPETLGRIVEAKQTVKIPLSSSSGTWEWSDAVAYILVGASTVEICSAAYFKGRKIFGEVVKGIEKWMREKGYHSLDEFRGKLLPRVRTIEDYCPEVSPVPSPITPVIDYELCNLCTMCLDGCIYGGIDRRDKEKGVIVMNKQLCQGCGMCVSRCPRGAMKLVDESGAVYWDGRGEAKFWL